MTRLTIVTCCLLVLGACNSSKKTAETVEQTAPKRQQGQPGRQQGPRDAAQTIARMDANSDGKLSISEVKGPLKENFAKIDSNGDGFLNKAEIESVKPRGGKRPQRN